MLVIQTGEMQFLTAVKLYTLLDKITDLYRRELNIYSAEKRIECLHS
jgi:hypothetical protein